MSEQAIQHWAASRAGELPGTQLEHPFGPDWDVYKVRGKVFMLQTFVAGSPITILKARPEDGAVLRQAYPEITPGYHMNKKHWITVHSGGSLDRALVADLVTESYLLVLERNVPKALWPVDPTRFGTQRNY